MKQRPIAYLSVFFLLATSLASLAQDHGHGDHQHGDDAPVERPKIFLDKSPRIVAYQLKRLDNQRLLLVERMATDKKYAPVYSAILSRAGMSPQYRDEALQALVKINQTDPVSELLSVLETMATDDDPQQARTGRQLSRMLLKQSSQQLMAQKDGLIAATEGDNSLLRSTGYAGLTVAGEQEQGWKLAGDSKQKTLDWLAATPLIPQADLRAGLRDTIVELLSESQPVNVRRAAVRAIAATPNDRGDTFSRLAPLVTDAKLRDDVVRTQLKIEAEHRATQVSRQLLLDLVEIAEATPPAERTTDAFIDAMQLADQLLAKTPAAEAKPLRDRLRKISVRVVRIHTVEEEMRYDTPYFAVEAGRPVQIVLENEDLMPHNLVITVPGALQEVAELGLQIGPKGHNNKPYVPDSDKVLFATSMVPSLGQERLTFDAPTVPGEYPFVCTFPRHWMRMYGVMVVTDDLDAWNRNPIVPKDPVGSNRAFVKKWTVEDLQADLDEGLRGRSMEIGAKLFKEGTCLQCHKIQGQGGAVGPELTDVFKRWKGDRAAVLREILDPSYRIDDKYAVHLIRTEDGETISGIITSETKDEIEILDNPESKEPRVIAVDEIDRKIKTSTSMMPKALLDRFSKDEIFEILAYLEHQAQHTKP